MLKEVRLVLATVAMGLSYQAFSAPITFDLVLDGEIPGTGQLTLNQLDTGPVVTYTVADPVNQILDLFVDIDGHRFDLSDAFAPPLVQLQSGNVYYIQFVASQPSGSSISLLGLLPTYLYSDLNTQRSSAGNTTAIIAESPSPVPLPGTLALMGIGLIALGLWQRIDARSLTAA